MLCALSWTLLCCKPYPEHCHAVNMTLKTVVLRALPWTISQDSRNKTDVGNCPWNSHSSASPNIWHSLVLGRQWPHLMRLQKSVFQLWGCSLKKVIYLVVGTWGWTLPQPCVLQDAWQAPWPSQLYNNLLYREISATPNNSMILGCPCMKWDVC